MRVRFWGTRGSIPKPGPTTLRHGGNTSCVELQARDGTRIILDCGSGAQDLGIALLGDGHPLRGHILISHTHWDHIQGLPFFAPLFVPGNEWDIYGPHAFCHSLRDALAGQMQSTYFPIALQQVGATTRYHDLVEGTFQIGDITIQTQYLNHPALTLGYRLEADGVAVVYACDHEPYVRELAAGEGDIAGQDRAHAKFLADADLVIHDAQYRAEEYPDKIGWGHSTVEYAIRLCGFAGVKRLALTHHDPLRDDHALDQIVKTARARAVEALQIFAAAEGQVVELAARPSRRRRHPLREFPATSPLPAALREQSILLVAKDPVVAEPILACAAADRVAVLRASDAAAAIKLLKTRAVSLVVVDDQPPGLDALEICRSIRSLGASPVDVPVVVVADEARRGSTAGADAADWLVKPFTEAYLRAKLHAWLMRMACRWQRAPVPDNEDQRLITLQRLGLLDTEPEERFDRVCRVAATLFNVPIVLVSIVDQDRQWFKSHLGLDVTETSRELSICAHAILSDGITVVPDTLLDHRFADNPLVVGKPRIRFYVGCPLIIEDGIRIGTLCLIDTRPRWLDDGHMRLLKDLRDLVQHELRPSPRSTNGSAVTTPG